MDEQKEGNNELSGLHGASVEMDVERSEQGQRMFVFAAPFIGHYACCGESRSASETNLVGVKKLDSGDKESLSPTTRIATARSL